MDEAADERISFSSFLLDQVIVNNDGNGDENENHNLEYFSGVLEEVSHRSDQKYYINHGNQFDTYEPSSNIGIVNVTSKAPQSNSIQANQCKTELLEDLQLDQVTVENYGSDDGDDENENLEYFSGVLEEVSHGSDHKYYIVHSNQFDIHHSNNTEIVNSLSKPPQSNFIQVQHKTEFLEDIQISFQEFDGSKPHYIIKDKYEYSTVTQVARVSNEIKQESEKERKQISGEVNILPEYSDIKREVTIDESPVKKGRVWNCEHCPGLAFLSRASHQRHRSRHPKAPPRNYPCTECELTFPRAALLKSHMLSEHQHYRPHKCTMCSKNFSKLMDLKKHSSSRHNSSELRITNSHTTEAQARIQKHKPTQESKGKPTQESKNKPTQDQKDKSTQEQISHWCSKCELPFLFPSRLKSHILAVHQNHRPHECPTCSKTFSSLNDMKKHMNIHTKLKKYACATCGRQFTDASNLERHKLSHSKATPHACPVCGKRYSQLSSLRKHRTNSAAAILGKCGETSVAVRRRFHCRICGHSFNTKTLLQAHSKLHEDSSKVSSLGRSVDALIENILQEDTKDRIENTEIEIVEECGHDEPTENAMEESSSNYYEIELINEIDRLEYLSENITQNALPPPDIFTSDVGNVPNISEYIQLTDYAKDENLGTVYKASVSNNEMIASVVERDDECATIFESDVDLESSENLAANLNRLIAENNVEFVSTEHDDTFIINLDTSMDAEQLSDLLNIGIEVINENDDSGITKQNAKEKMFEHAARNRKPRDKTKRPKSFSCTHCPKTFSKRDNYISHMGNHEPTLSRHQCQVCSKKFGYRSTLNKHMRNAHTPVVWTTHTCHLCGDSFKHKWMLKDHKNGKHRKLRPFRCEVETCGKRFDKRSDFLYHCRQHTGERPYQCSLCGRRFAHASHRAKHLRRCKKRDPDGKSRRPNTRRARDKELLSDIEDLVRSKMDAS